VQDAIIIVCSNIAFEVIAAFAVFSIIGFLAIDPSNTPRLGAFEVSLSSKGPIRKADCSLQIGFLTFPAALATMPGAQFWSVLFFLTLLLLGISSTYPMLEVICTFIFDRWAIASVDLS
jgi:solute carrier family 6 GABA transporter-like protein 1